jgi:hypothetical protein
MRLGDAVRNGPVNLVLAGTEFSVRRLWCSLVEDRITQFREDRRSLAWHR